MTSPLQHGFPDWARWAATSDAVFINDNNHSTNVPVTYDLGFVGSQPALYCWADPTIGQLRADFQFYADQAETILIDHYPVDVTVNNIGREPVPILGPFLKIVASVAAPLPATYSLRVFSMPQRDSFRGFFVGAADLSADVVNIGAGATIVSGITNVTSGIVEWSGFMGGANFSMGLETLAFDGTGLTVLDRFDNSASPWAVRQVNVPPMPLQVRITNNTGVIQPYSVHVTRRYGR